MSSPPEFQDLSTSTGFSNEVANQIIPFPQTTTHALKTDWTPDKCLSIAKSRVLPTHTKEVDYQRHMMLQFIQFYTTGNVPDSYDITDVILSAASLIYNPTATTAEDLAWPAEFYETANSKNLNFKMLNNTPTVTASETSNNNPPQTPAPILVHVTDAEFETLGTGLKYKEQVDKDPSVKTVKTRPEDNLETLLQHASPLLEQYPTDSLKDFFDYCKTVLGKSSPTGAPTLEVLQLFKLLNFTALTMLRATVKNHCQLIASFLKKQYRENVGAFIGPTLREKFTPPCARSLSKAHTYLNKARPEISSFMAKLVHLSVTANRDVKAYLDASVLTHTSWNGLGIIAMIFNICQFFNISWVELYKLTLIDSTVATWKVVIEFLLKHQRKDSPDMTAPWARVIDDAYFTKMGPQNHPVLSSLLKRSLEYSQGDEGLSESVWAQRHHQLVSRFNAGSEWVLKQLNKTEVKVTPGAKESVGLAEVINKPPVSETPVGTTDTNIDYIL